MFRLHTFLRPLLPDNRFATTVIGHLREDGVLAIANGGHCPVLIARKDGTIEEITSTGPVVGMLPAPQWCSAVVQLERGDTVLLYSDGLLEAHCGEGDDFGLARIKQALAEASRLPTARETAAAIVDVAESYAGEGLRGDDLTLVVVRM
jgi:sigma-B regulation protein RsbU (phosphoserine phosphatase)